MEVGSGKFKPFTARFGTSNDEIKDKILETSNSKNTNRATKSSVAVLKAYISEKKLQNLENTPDADLPNLLEDFYVSAKTKTGELYNTQSMKGIRSGLNRHFKRHRQIDIIADPTFRKANGLFTGVQKLAKRSGKGLRRSTPVIAESDMMRLAMFFNIDHIQSPNPSVLQRNVMFNLMYYLCRRGQENIYDMTKDWFAVKQDTDGRRYLMQVQDEADKNHTEKDCELTNQGRMYEVPGKYNIHFLSSQLRMFKIEQFSKRL